MPLCNRAFLYILKHIVLRQQAAKILKEYSKCFFDLDQMSWRQRDSLDRLQTSLTGHRLNLLTKKTQWDSRERENDSSACVCVCVCVWTPKIVFMRVRLDVCEWAFTHQYVKNVCARVGVWLKLKRKKMLMTIRVCVCVYLGACVLLRVWVCINSS